LVPGATEPGTAVTGVSVVDVVGIAEVPVACPSAVPEPDEHPAATTPTAATAHAASTPERIWGIHPSQWSRWLTLDNRRVRNDCLRTDSLSMFTILVNSALTGLARRRSE
jgi:hypothetical protein